MHFKKSIIMRKVRLEARESEWFYSYKNNNNNNNNNDNNTKAKVTITFLLISLHDDVQEFHTRKNTSTVLK